jgi:hypothetical protein
LRQELLHRQKTFKPVALRSIGVRNDEDGRPLHAKALEALRILLDVNFYRNEIFIDEGRDPRIGIYLGIQPSASPSHRGRTEIEKNCFARLGSLPEG